MWGRAGQEEQEVAGHTASADRKLREVNTGTQLTSYSVKTSAHGMVMSTSGWVFLL